MEALKIYEGAVSLMKTIILVLCLFLFLSGNATFAKSSDSACMFKGKKLYGKIKIVTSFPDIKVKVVESFPDLKVKIVDSFPDSCGEWKMVESFPDTKIQFVESFPDIKIKYVTSFPGLK